MQLVRNERWSRWEALTAFGEAKAPKAAGMRWDPEAKRWHTDDAEVAHKLARFADEATHAALKAALEAAKAEAAAAPRREPEPLVRLSYSEDRSRWEAATLFAAAGSVPKAAGMRWDPIARVWHTDDVLKAFELRSLADKATQARLETEAAAARVEAEAAAERARQSVEASRATDAAIEIPIAPGRAFLPYQRAGIAFGLARPSVLIGDDMGLGKTAQAIGIINADESLRRILVICPASLARNWAREIATFGSRPLSVAIAGTKKLPQADITITTYDVFSRKTATAAAIRGQEWDALILDEAHYCKNRESARTRNILGGEDRKEKVEGIRARRRIYLTGTPMTNRPVELWPLVHSLAPEEFGDFWAFARDYCDARNNGYGWDFTGASNLAELQDRLRATVMVRRLKEDVLKELPPKRRQIIELPADTDATRAALKAEARAEAANEDRAERLAAARARVELAKASEDPADYRAAVAALKAAENVPFEEMSAFRHQTAVAKSPMVSDHVREIVEAGSKVIVMAHHADVVNILRNTLSDLGVVVITGETPVGKRQDAVDAFQSRDDIRVFVGNIQAAGVGLTLTASAHVVFGELDWVPGNLSQAEDRAHRLGQRNAVLVQHLVLEGSLDARMAATIVEKQRVINAALDGVENPAERERRIAAAQASLDGAVAAAEAALVAGEAEAGKRNAAVLEAALAGADPARAASADATPDTLAEAAAALPPEQVAAIHEGLRILAGMDEDGAREINGVGYNKLDTRVGRALAEQDALTPRQAALGMLLVRRYRRQLPPDLLAAALGTAPAPTREAAPAPEGAPSAEPAPAAGQVAPAAEDPAPKPEQLDLVEFIAALDASPAEPEPTPEPARWFEDPAWIEGLQEVAARRAAERRPAPAEVALEVEPEAVPAQMSAPAGVVLDAQAPRRRGRPPKGERALTAAERNRLWKQRQAVTAIEVPGDVVERLRGLRDARGVTMAELLREAMDALERPAA